MQGRFQRLEDQVTVLVADVAVIKSNYATKQDIEAIKADVAVIKSNYATQEDIQTVKVMVESVKVSVESVKVSVESAKGELYKAMAAQTRWLATLQFVTLGAGISLAKYLF